MNLHEYKLLLQQTETVSAEQTVDLKVLLKQYPYLQSAYAMRLKGLYNENSYQYNHTLKLAAAYTTDRTVLFDFITSEDFAKVSNSAIVEESVQVPSAQVEIQEVSEEQLDQIRPRKQSVLDSIESSEISSEELEEEQQLISKEEEPISAEQSVLEMIENAQASTEDKNVEKISTEQFSIEDNLAEAKKIKPELSLAKEISVKEELGTPLEFSTTEKHSFKEWLQLSKAQPIIREESIEQKKELSEIDREKIKKTDLINRFIIASPKIPPVKNDTKIPVILETSGDTSTLMTETLARVYLEQKKFQKAIQAYQILILKYPEKSSFFADRISDIKKIQQNN